MMSLFYTFIIIIVLTLLLTLNKPSKAQLIRYANNFSQICSIFNYLSEEHFLITPDGYHLLLHRILPSTPSKTTKKKPVVLIQHGLLTNSEFLIALTDAHRAIPFVLVDNGYDVWLGNNRGNKYSQKHTTHPPTSPAFWDFSLDDLASSDLPSFVAYILAHTRSPTLAFIGFSQGSAQAFAALSTLPSLNAQLSLFIALAPIMRPRGFASPFIDRILKKNPSLIPTIFGTHALFPIVSTLQRLIPPPLLALIADTAVRALLGSTNANLSRAQKTAGYAHIYCPSSVKSVLHWTRIMRHGRFAKFDDADDDDDDNARYQTERITTPMVLIHGSCDPLFDPEAVIHYLPSSVTIYELDGYEHIDILWGENVHLDVIPKVLAALRASSSS